MKPFQIINLLIVDDNVLIINAIENLFKTSNHINIVGNCADGNEVIPFILTNKIDVIFMDMIMEKVGGFEAIKRVKNYNSKIKIIGFSLIDHIDFINKVMVSGADGFVSKYDAGKELIEKELHRVIGL